MLLYYIRHGDPTYDPDALTPLGRRQAEAAAKRLAVYGLDEIYVSSSNRAIETSRPTCEILKKEATVLDWTNESHAWADLSYAVDGNGGRRWAYTLPEVRKLFVSKEIRELDDHWYDHPAFEGTRMKPGFLRILNETRNFLKGLGFDWDEEKRCYLNTADNEKRIALFAHQGFGLAFLSSVLDIPYPMVSEKMDMSHSDISVIRFDTSGKETVPVLLQLSNDSHLYRAGLPTRYINRYEI